jgi:hypothetical protein
VQLHHGEGAVHTNVNKTFPTVVMLPFSSPTSKTNKLDQLVTTTSHSNMNQSQNSTMVDNATLKAEPVPPWKIAIAFIGVFVPYATVSNPLQAIDFSAMNINHALVRLESILSNPSSQIHPLKSILSNPSSQIHPLKSILSNPSSRICPLESVLSALQPDQSSAACEVDP